jgi:hypothetical protein
MGLSSSKGGLLGSGKFSPGDGDKALSIADLKGHKLKALSDGAFEAGMPLAASFGPGPGGAEAHHVHALAGFRPADAAGPVKPPPRRPGLPERILHGVGRALSSPDLGTRLAMAQALANGDTATAARLSLEVAEMRQQRARARAAEARRQSGFNNLIKLGMSPGDAELAMLDPDGFGREFNTRFRTTPNAGETIDAAAVDGGGFSPMADAGRADEEEGAVAIGPGGRRFVVRGGRWVPES